MRRFTPILLCFLLGSTAQAAIYANLTSLVLERNDSVRANSLICLTKEWEAVDSGLHAEILRLKEQSPEAFSVVDAENTNLCFDPEQVNETGKELLVQILNRISEITEHQITVSTRNDSFRNENRSFGRKLLRASAIIQGTQMVGFSALLVLPPSITKWEESPLKSAGPNFKRAWSNPPVWDKDDWAINYIGHPYSGSLYYNALRSQGASPLSSFLFSTAQSLIWEYGLEATVEQPSIQDLLFTSTAGSVLGELSHRATIRMGRNGYSTLEKVTVIIINPMYALNNGFKKRHAKPRRFF